MLKISNNRIHLTRGDNATIQLELTYSDGSAYVPTENDTIYFRIKKNASSKEVLCEKELYLEEGDGEEGEETLIFLSLNEEDTIDLKFSKYKYEIEVVQEGDIHSTVIEDADIEIGAELENHMG